MDNEQLQTTLLDLVEKSEARIDRTNAMIQQLTNTCQNSIEVYDKHLTSLEESRNVAQESAMASLKLSTELTAIIARLRDDYQAQIVTLKTELQDIRCENKDLSSSYRRLAERFAASGSSAEVNINQNK